MALGPATWDASAFLTTVAGTGATAFEVGMSSTTFLDAFWSKVQVTDSGCWVWQGSRQNQNYGLKYLRSLPSDNRKSVKALTHRLAYELVTQSEVPQSLLVCHTCDNPPCCNPDHMFVGTSKDNVRDAVQKGRFRRIPKPSTKPRPLKKHCKWGHILVDLGYRQRVCRECMADGQRKIRARRFQRRVADVLARRVWGVPLESMSDDQRLNALDLAAECLTVWKSHASGWFVRKAGK